MRHCLCLFKCFTFSEPSHALIPRVVPSGPGMHGPPAGSCVRCGPGAVCREGRAAADRTYNRTVVSPGHAPDRSEPEDKSGIKLKRTHLKHVLAEARKSRSLDGVHETYMCHRASFRQAKEGHVLSNSSESVQKTYKGIKQV